MNILPPSREKREGSNSLAPCGTDRLSFGHKPVAANGCAVKRLIGRAIRRLGGGGKGRLLRLLLMG